MKSDILLRDAGMVQLCKGLGMPDVLITGETTHFHVLMCFIAAYTYGEIQGSHDLLKDRRMKEWFGEREFGEGRLTRELAALRDGKRQVNGVNMSAMMEGVAEILAGSIVMKQGPFAFDPAQIIPPPASIKGSQVFFGGNYGQREYSHLLPQPIKSVIELDPGVRSLNNLDQLIQLSMRNPTALFQYMTINSPFMVRLLTSYFSMRCQQISGDGSLEKTLLEHDVYSPIEGDIIAKTQRIIDWRRQRNEPVDFSDLVLYVSYHAPRINLAEAEQVIKNVYQLLRPGGAFLLGFSMTQNAKGYVSAFDLLPLAIKLGFVENQATVHADMANARLPLYAFLVK